MNTVTQAKHTPGPWLVTRLGESVYVVNADDMDICDVTERPSQEANARLIAAAPDLLAACEAVIHNDRGFAAKARAAIAKATGDVS